MAKKMVSKAKLATGAVVLLQQVLANEEVRKALANAPRDVIRWATKKRDEYKASGSAGRFDPTQRFGQKGLERRINSLFEVSSSAFPERNDPGRAENLKQQIIIDQQSYAGNYDAWLNKWVDGISG